MAKSPIVNQTGLIFRETFRTVGDVVENGGTINAGASIGGGMLSTDGTDDNGIAYTLLRTDLWDTGFSLRFRIKFNDTAESNNRFFFYGLDGNRFIQMTYHPTNEQVQTNIRTATGSSYHNTSNLSVSTGVWYDVAATWDADNTTLSTYIDGGDEQTDNSAGAATLFSPGTDYNVLEVGFDDTSATDSKCDIDDFRLYDRPLTIIEVQDIADPAGESTFGEVDDARAVISLPLRSYYEDGSGDSVTENIGSMGGTATLGDGTTTTTFPTQLTPHGMSFDGGDYLDLGDDIFTNASMASGSIVISGSYDGDQAGDDYFYSLEGVVFLRESAGQWQVQVFDGSGTTALYGAVDSNIHQHIVTWDGTNAYVYLDGEEVATFTSDVPVFDSFSRGNKIGARFDTNAGDFFTGNLYKFRAFNEALTPTQVKWLYLKDKRLLNI